MVDPADLPLRDIHLPEPVSWWPPAPGWWLLAATVATAVLAGLLLYIIWRRGRLKRAALGELDRLKAAYAEHRDPVEMIRNVSTLLRRASISFYPRETTASLTGKDWLAHLDRTCRSGGFDSEAGRTLIDGPYARYIDAAHVDRLVTVAEKWLRAQSRWRRTP